MLYWILLLGYVLEWQLTNDIVMFFFPNLNTEPNPEP